MHIVISGSMRFSKKMRELACALESLGHSTELPVDTEHYLDESSVLSNKNEDAQKKIDEDLIKNHYNKIKNCEAVLVVNEDKGEVANYIGGNTFLEMGFAYVLDKKIFLLNEIPDLSYRDELIAMQPAVLCGDLNKIK